MPYNPFFVPKPRAINVPAGYSRSNPINVSAGYSKVGVPSEIDLIKSRLESQLKLNLKVNAGVPVAAPNLSSPVVNISNNVKTNPLTQFLTNPNTGKISRLTATSIKEASSIVRIARLASRLSPLMRIADAVDLATNSLQPTISGEEEAAAIKRAQDKLLQSGSEPGVEISPAVQGANFTGGQGSVPYDILISFSYSAYPPDPEYLVARVLGPIGGVRLFESSPPRSSAGDTLKGIEVLCCGYINQPRQTQSWFVVSDGYGYIKSINSFSVRRSDGQPDTGGNLPPTSQPSYSSPGTTIASPQTYQREIGDRQPEPLNNQIKMPSLAPLKPDFGIELIPDLLIGDVIQPAPVIEPPSQAPNLPPPVNNAAIDTAPKLGDVATIYGPLSDPNTIKIVSPFGASLTSPLPVGQPFANTGVDRTPQPAPLPTKTPNTTPSPEKTELEKTKEDLERLITGGAAIAGLTPAIQAIGEKVVQTAQQTTPEALETAAAAGTCRTTQPGGCTTKALDDAVGRINQNSNNNANALDAANALANAKQLEQLGIINNKLGEQLPNGGIGAKLSRFINWSVGDRVIGMMSMVASVHNAFMLSNNVGETLFSILDNLGNIGALIVKPDGDTNIDSKTWVTSNLDSLFSTMLGASTWKSVKASYRAANNILSTSSNAYNNLRSIHNDSQELLNMVRRDTAELGNALVEEGVISEDNWDVRDPKIKIKSKMLNRLDNMNRGLEEVDNKLEAIEQVTSTLLNIAQTAKEVRENVDSLNKELGDASKAFKDTRDKAIEALPDFDFDIDDLY